MIKSTSSETPPLNEFDFSALAGPEFKEDSVREEIISPILSALGYASTGEYKTVRSRALQHPYVSIGSIKRKITIVPDYLLEVRSKPQWILDAKAPWENLDDFNHISQAYSYAIHRDVRVNWYALCNGHELRIFHVADMDSTPRFIYEINKIQKWWPDFFRNFSPPLIFSKTRGEYKKDLGVHLLKLKVPKEKRLVFVGVPVAIVSRVYDDLYAISAAVGSEADEYVATFDFNGTQLEQLLSILPEPFNDLIRQTVKHGPGATAHFSTDVHPAVVIEAVQGGNMEENEKEHYIPLRVAAFR